MTHDVETATRVTGDRAQPWWLPALAGVVAVGLSLGVGELAAAFVDLRSSPLVSVDGVVVDWAPPAGKDLAIEWFGTNDKLALQIGTMVLLGLIAGGLGVLAWRRRWVVLATFGVLAAAAVAAALSRAGAGVLWALPGLVAAGAGAGAQLVLLRRLDAVADTDRTVGSAPDPAGRRRFLGLSLLALVGAGIAGFLSRAQSRSTSVEGARQEVAAELPEPSGGPAPAVPGSDVPDLTYVTPNDRFYRIDTALVVPQVDPAGWSLTIDGRVGRPLRLSFEELLARPMVERYITLACVSNPVGGTLIGNARWLGVPIADLLDEAQPDPGADQVVSTSVDGFTAGTPTAVLRDGRDALFAVAMNGEPLPVEHGFPVRMVVPGLYGYVSATKWVTRLELTSFDAYDAYWARRGWAPQAPVKTASRIDRPRNGSQIDAGEYMVAGAAWAMHRGISAVQVRVDGGAWQDATLANTASVDTWRLWSWRWAATPGEHTIEVRAADNSGQFQTSEVVPPAPDGATGYHRISVEVA